jgi:hypothetical protein
MTPSPGVDDHTRAIIEQAAESLANLRGLPCPDDPGVQLHTLASLAQQTHASLRSAVLEARRHDYGWDEIAEFVGTSTVTAQRRYDHRQPIRA